MADFINQDLPVSSIKSSRHPRQFQGSDIERFSQSLASTGLLAPIVVGADNHLIAGKRRLEAAKHLGWKTIPARVANIDKDDAELACLAENLEREDYIEVERVRALARYRELFNTLHPPECGGRGHKGTTDSVVGLAATKVADATGRAPVTVERDMTLGDKIDDQAAETIKATPSGDNKQELQALATLPPKKQRTVAANVASGKAKNVRSQVPKKPAAPKAGTPKTDCRLWSEIEGYLGKAMNRTDTLQKDFPHSLLHRRLTAQINVCIRILQEWKTIVNHH